MPRREVIRSLAQLARRAKTTILMAVHNEEPFVARAIESALGQTEQAFRLLIVDDGSKDRSGQVARKYLYDPRVRVLWQRHRGTGAALQKALGQVETPYAMRLDGDDELFPNALEVLQKTIERMPPEVGMCYANHVVLDEHTGKRAVQRGRAVRSKYDVLSFRGPMAPRVYRVSALRAVGGWACDDPLRGRFMEDRLLEIKLCGRFAFHWVDRELYLRRFHGENQSGVAAREYTRLRKWAARQALKDWNAPYTARFRKTRSGLKVDLVPKRGARRASTKGRVTRAPVPGRSAPRP